MKNNYTYQFCDANSILLISQKGKLRRLYTPFKVQCIDPVGKLTKGLSLFVDEVQSAQKDELVFVINDQAYYHSHFSIMIYF